MIAFEQWWTEYGESLLRMFNGDMKEFAMDVWEGVMEGKREHKTVKELLSIMDDPYIKTYPICRDCKYQSRFGGCILNMGEIMNKISCPDFESKDGSNE